METNKILQSDYLDLIFDNRNKTYGGYELRKHYNRRALKALGITFSVLVLAIGGPLLLGKDNSAQLHAAVDTLPETIFSPITLPEPPADIPEPPKAEHAAPPATAKTIANTEPVIVPPDVKPNIDPPDPEDLENAVSGPVNNAGNDGKAIAMTTEVNKGPFGTGDGGPAKHGGGGGLEGGGKEPVMAADEMPAYPGGMEALRKFVSSHIVYPNAAREEGIRGKVVVKFVVDEEGAITKAVVVKGIGGGCDKEALRVVNAMPRWKPGKVKGRAVKVYYMLPITFELN